MGCCHVQPPLPCPDVGNVGYPNGVWGAHLKLSVKRIRVIGTNRAKAKPFLIMPTVVICHHYFLITVKQSEL